MKKKFIIRVRINRKMKPNEKRLIEEYYRERLIKKIKKALGSLIHIYTHKYYDEQEVGFQNGWNDALEHFRDNEIDDIK